MEPRPRTSLQQDLLSPKQKRPKVAFSATEKLMVRNVYKYVLEEKSASLPVYEFPRKEECVSKTAEILGISTSTVYNILKEYKENKQFKSPEKTGPKHDFRDKLDDSTFAAIKRKVHQFYCTKEAPTIAKVLKAVNDDSALPSFSLSTMSKILKHLNFKFATKSRKSINQTSHTSKRLKSQVTENHSTN